MLGNDNSTVMLHWSDSGFLLEVWVSVFVFGTLHHTAAQWRTQRRVVGQSKDRA